MERVEKRGPTQYRLQKGFIRNPADPPDKPYNPSTATRPDPALLQTPGPSRSQLAPSPSPSTPVPGSRVMSPALAETPPGQMLPPDETPPGSISLVTPGQGLSTGRIVFSTYLPGTNEREGVESQEIIKPSTPQRATPSPSPSSRRRAVKYGPEDVPSPKLSRSGSAISLAPPINISGQSTSSVVPPIPTRSTQSGSVSAASASTPPSAMRSPNRNPLIRNRSSEQSIAAAAAREPMPPIPSPGSTTDDRSMTVSPTPRPLQTLVSNPAYRRAHTSPSTEIAPYLETEIPSQPPRRPTPVSPFELDDESINEEVYVPTISTAGEGGTILDRAASFREDQITSAGPSRPPRPSPTPDLREREPDVYPPMHFDMEGPELRARLDSGTRSNPKGGSAGSSSTFGPGTAMRMMTGLVEKITTMYDKPNPEPDQKVKTTDSPYPVLTEAEPTRMEISWPFPALPSEAASTIPSGSAALSPLKRIDSVSDSGSSFAPPPFPPPKSIRSGSTTATLPVFGPLPKPPGYVGTQAVSPPAQPSGSGSDSGTQAGPIPPPKPSGSGSGSVPSAALVPVLPPKPSGSGFSSGSSPFAFPTPLTPRRPSAAKLAIPKPIRTTSRPTISNPMPIGATNDGVMRNQKESQSPTSLAMPESTHTSIRTGPDGKKVLTTQAERDARARAKPAEQQVAEMQQGFRDIERDMEADERRRLRRLAQQMPPSPPGQPSLMPIDFQPPLHPLSARLPNPPLIPDEGGGNGGGDLGIAGDNSRSLNIDMDRVGSFGGPSITPIKKTRRERRIEQDRIKREAEIERQTRQFAANFGEVQTATAIPIPLPTPKVRNCCLVQ